MKSIPEKEIESRMAYANNDGLKIYYESTGLGEAGSGETGSSETIVFAHGFTTDLRSWAKQAEWFSPRYNVVTFDSRGHGKSDSPETNYSRDHRQTDLLAVVNDLGIEKFHLVGLSMGGATSIGVALDFPERLISLTLISSGVTGTPSIKQDQLLQIVREKGVEAAKEVWIKSTLKYYENKPGYARDILNQMMSEHGGKPWQDPNRGKYTHRDDMSLLREMRIPTLVLVGERDIGFVKMGKRLSEAIPMSILETLPNVGHMINIEVPELFNKRLEIWLTDRL